ncbi:uncharacterized protein LOC132932990 [Metopolophium dirhodum]|uniref:uncharacterized protein LOC132932979 n=1 Tax=Metopolophium dirhodum TaxID=44670 RepID=UPI00298FD5D0|nr:uncharacterized protein LOC132932979 [Metopolophium dirhodum]XP_060855311.1 uncharacterized protein LOC132932990 [Metopolophium dirhodum]
MSTALALNHSLNQHLMYNLNVHPKNDAICTLLDQKIWLVKTELVVRYIARFQSSIEGIVKWSHMVVNATETIHHRMLCMLDLDFQCFISSLDTWWKFYHTVDDVNLQMGCPGENHSAHNIIIDKECMAMFRLPPVDNYNETLILACTYLYFSYSKSPSNHTLNTLFNHVKIVMTMCNHPFTTKTNFKFTINSLINQKYISTHQIHKKTTYHIENLPKIKSLFSKHYDTTINRIINITQEEYITTAMQHSLPTTLWKNTPHKPSYINKEYTFNKLLRKTKFISSFLNSLTLTLNNTTTDIHTAYKQNLKTYKQHLDILLTTHPLQDTTLTFEELLKITTNDQHEIPTHNTHNTHTPTKISPLRTYINEYYI